MTSEVSTLSNGSAPHGSHLRFSQFGDSALLISSHLPDKEDRWRSAHVLADRLRNANLKGIESIVATFETFTVEFNPLVIDNFTLYQWLVNHSDGLDEFTSQGRTVDIPIVYGGEFGPDLRSVADHLELSEDEVIQKHSETSWRVAFNGGPAGAPLHEGNAFNSPIPRMSEPRVRIPAGTIALSGSQGTVYTVPAPGGWRLIGTTPVQMNNLSGQPFVALSPGDYLRFRPITPDEYYRTPPVFVGDLL